MPAVARRLGTRQPEQVRLATFNILHGRSPADGRVDVERFAAAVRRIDADVLALQEVDRHQERSAGADLTAVAADAMGAAEHRFVAALAGTPGATWLAATGEEQPDSAAYGIALLSRYPVHDWHVVRLPALRRRVPMLFPGRRRPVLVHDEPRVAVAALVQLPQGEATVVATHLTFLPGWNAHQLRRLVRQLAGSHRPLVVMGDLNMEPHLAARASGLRPLVSAPTYPVADPRRQLDHVLADGRIGDAALGAVTGTSLPLPLSDHRALVVDV
jgi:endonuclease/exonuclease/phosphatase family metal-dependent hydrolase